MRSSPRLRRLAATPRRIGFIILRTDCSAPVASHPASQPATQLLSATKRVTPFHVDFHHADYLSSRTQALRFFAL